MVQLDLQRSQCSVLKMCSEQTCVCACVCVCMCVFLVVVNALWRPVAISVISTGAYGSPGAVRGLSGCVVQLARYYTCIVVRM